MVLTTFFFFFESKKASETIFKLKEWNTMFNAGLSLKYLY